MKDEYERFRKSLDRLGKTIEAAQVKVLESLSSLPKENILKEISEMDKGMLKSVHKMALKGEYFEICAAIKEYQDL